MLNKVRYLIGWMYEHTETRYKALDYEHRIPVSTIFKVPCKWVEKYIISLCHQYQEYHDQFRISYSSGNRDPLTISRMYLIDVYDIPLQRNYTADVSDHSCTCHVPYWKKVSCLHVIAVLCFRNEISRVWKFVGDEYRQCGIVQTCRRLSEVENEVLNSILSESSPMIPIMHEGFDGFGNKRGREVKNSRRVCSRGEE